MSLTHDQIYIDPHYNIIDTVTITIPGNKTLLANAQLNISFGRKYGLFGINGSGKSTLLRNIAANQESVVYIDQEAPLNNSATVYDEVKNSNITNLRLTARLAILEAIETPTDEDMDEMNTIYDQMDHTDEARVHKILHGLGFNKDDQQRQICHFSGGFRMRIALAKALYLKPPILLLDEPNNHLDLDSMIWLTQYLAEEWTNTLILVSHDRHFLNSVCTDIIHLADKQLYYYTGNYDKFVYERDEQLRIATKKWQHVQSEIKGMRRKNMTKEKIDEYMKTNAMYEPKKPYRVRLNFGHANHIQDTIVHFDHADIGYDGKILISDVSLDINMASKYIIVGKNGVGKTTLFKTIMHQIPVLSGEYHKNTVARIGYYHQHATDVLPLDMTPVQYISSLDAVLGEQDVRKYLGTVGLDGTLHHQKIRILSGGQKSRVLFVSVFVQKPHIMLLDEPTNHLDIATIDALIASLNDYNGAILMTTHNIDVIEKTGHTFSVLEICDGMIEETDFESYSEKVLVTDD